MWRPATIQIYSWGYFGFYYWSIHRWQSYISHDTNISQETTCLKITVYVYYHFRCEKKLLPIQLELLNLSTSQLNLEICHGHWNKNEKGIQKLMNIQRNLFITGLYIIHKLCNHQLSIISEKENWWLHWTAIGSKIVIAGVCQRI